MKTSSATIEAQFAVIERTQKELTRLIARVAETIRVSTQRPSTKRPARKRP